jgi:hypothetical protein
MEAQAMSSGVQGREGPFRGLLWWHPCR